MCADLLAEGNPRIAKATGEGIAEIVPATRSASAWTAN